MIRKTVLLLFMLRKLLVINAAAYFSAFADGTMHSHTCPLISDVISCGLISAMMFAEQPADI